MRAVLTQVEPTVRVAEGSCPEIGGVEVNQELQVILNFEVYEKTKSYVILKIGHIHMLSPKRRY